VLAKREGLEHRHREGSKDVRGGEGFQQRRRGAGRWGGTRKGALFVLNVRDGGGGGAGCAMTGVRVLE